MKLLNRVLIILLISLLHSCVENENAKNIVGNWKGAEWLIDEKQSERNVAETKFTFDDKGVYTFLYGSKLEKGTYKVENEMLFTKPAEGQEIMVKINKLNKDSLVFDMNRSGVKEILTLVKSPD